ncbi:helix-turn-helix domain-containing protein, partial [Nonomuraea sp. NPDC055795]
MLETSARLLKLLSLLQAHKEWSGPELADRLQVSTRTVRNDVERPHGVHHPAHPRDPEQPGDLPAHAE